MFDFIFQQKNIQYSTKFRGQHFSNLQEAHSSKIVQMGHILGFQEVRDLIFLSALELN